MEETNVPVVAKKIWNIVRMMFHMLRKGIISKRKLMLDLNLMMKRGKIASKAIPNLMSSHSHKPHHINCHVSSPPREYEFSCSDSPTFFKRRTHRHVVPFFACIHVPSTDDDMANAADVAASPAFWSCSEGSSPAMSRFGRTPAAVRRVRITDSPFPLCDMKEDCHVDEAAAEFISRFYKELRRQN